MTTVGSVYPNREAIDRCLHTYLDGMCPFVVRHLKQKRGVNVIEAIRNSISGGYAPERRVDDFSRSLEKASGEVEAALDVGIVRTVVEKQWYEIFRDAFGRDDTVRSAIHCITDIRNQGEAHRGSGDVGATVALTLMELTITVLRHLNRPQDVERVSQEKDAVLERCIAAHQQKSQSPNFQENISRAAELEDIATQADERLQQANAALALLQGVIGLERVSAERVAAVAAHEAAVSEHEAAVAEHEAAVAEHEAAMIALKEAIDRRDAAQGDIEFSKANFAIYQAAERAAAALEREKAADAEEAVAELRETEANLHYVIAEDHMWSLSEAEEDVAAALRQAEVHGDELAEVVQSAKERKEAAQEVLQRAIAREQAADQRKGSADAREVNAYERAAASKDVAKDALRRAIEQERAADHREGLEDALEASADEQAAVSKDVAKDPSQSAIDPEPDEVQELRQKCSPAHSLPTDFPEVNPSTSCRPTAYRSTAKTKSGSRGFILMTYQYLNNKFVEPLRRQLREEGVAVCERQSNQRWRDWLRRQKEAQAKGEPFDEPPPDSVSPKGKDPAGE